MIFLAQKQYFCLIVLKNRIAYIEHY
jgi:hypothetical protein